jgi:glutaryl-CoA dehydrogenase
MSKPHTKRAAFQWDDPLLLDSQLDDDERAVRDATQAYCRDQLAPRVLEAFRHEKADVAIFREMGELGMLGTTLPEAYGGAGLNYVCYGLIARELERIDSGYRSMMSVQSSLVMLPIYTFGNEATKQQYLPKLATGEWIGCFGLTEPNFGSDPGGMLARARKAEGGYSLSGSKAWISNSPIADVFVVWAKDDEGEIRGFVLEKGWKGLSAPTTHGKVGLRTSVTGEIVMDAVFCPEVNAFPEVRGLKGPFTCLNSARYGIAWGALGAAEDCFARAPVRVGPRAVRPPAGRQPTHSKKAGGHVDRDQPRPAGLPAVGTHEGRGHGVGRGHQHPQAQLLRQGARHCALGARHAGRQRHYRRIGRQYLRGHSRHPRADFGPRHHRHRGVCELTGGTAACRVDREKSYAKQSAV